MERLSMSCTTRAIVGEPAPRFNCRAVVHGRIKEISLASMLASSQWTILVFFPMAWSFICPTEIVAFDARLSEFTARGCNVIFASCDSEHVLKAWNSTPREEGGLGNVSIPMLSDRNHRLSRDYGILCEEEGVAQRALFIIDPKGTIRVVNVNDANVGRSVDEVQRMLDALKFVDEFGEGCPVDWSKGQSGVQLRWRDFDEHSGVVDMRPSLSRGTSWSAAWGRATRPKTWSAGAGPATPPAQDMKSKAMVWSRESSAGESFEEHGARD